MCIAIPSLVTAVDDMVATVERHGQTRQVSLLMMGEPVQPGDYVLVQAGGFAVERIDESVREETLRLFDEVMAVS